ncbi:uncharacterized protein Z519_00657 [Cladophialophora bantiana CBS 173.52]|uniref:CHAT domain-containing protein n=1 Tax=Cladophialophora bantiana (strain ATCC 10958 / CBS 173.52 / CDC B-1940 / NIH 8579) TaxID=1442370 RepID=A0A0D2IQK4_CLAB1|nr:uncharacterized protein Z519_00657 [Cladophialophora bantiana CBS 173.52]KIW98994.1 hypothetical protein Z519_00657 [Cladophialophora bantiana CBS 173.52]
MDFKKVSDFFGGTIFPAEYRVDLQDSDRRITELEKAILLPPTIRDQASIILLRLIHSAMSGDLARADSCLERLSQLPDRELGPSWPIRWDAYSFYITCLKRVPPILRFWTGRNNQISVLRDYGLSVQDSRRRQINLKAHLRNEIQNQLDKLEYHVIYDVFDFHSYLWMQAFEHHPQYPDRFLGFMFDSSEPSSPATIDSAHDLGLTKTAACLKKLTLQYLLAGASKNATAALHDLEASDEKIFPVALNLMPHGRDLGWDNEAMDSIETSLAPQNADLARSCYLEAYHLFEAAGSHAGMGAVSLRYACIDHVQAIEEMRRATDGSTAQLLENAREHLQNAVQLCSGDNTHSLIVSGHILMLNISNDRHQDVLSQAYEIGDRCRPIDNVGVSQFLGMLLLRLGRKFFLLPSGVQRALICCDCAEVCCYAFRDPYLQLSAVVSLAAFQRKNGNVPTATAHIEHGRTLLDQAADHIDRLSAHADTPDHRHILKSVRANCISGFNSLARSISSSSQRARQNVQNPADTVQGESSLEAMLNVLSSLSTDPSLKASADGLPRIETFIAPLRAIFQEANEGRRTKLRMNADIDAVDDCLKQALLQIEAVSLPCRSSEVDIYQIALLRQLGEFDRALQLLPLTMPRWLGGQGGNDSITGNLAPDISRLTSRRRRQDAKRYISLCFITKEWGLGSKLLGQVEQTIPDYLNEVRSALSPHGWMDMFWIGCIHEHSGNLPSALTWYIDAFQTVETNYRRLADINERRNLYDTVHSNELFFGLARVAWLLSQLEDQDEPVINLDQWQLTPAQWKEQVLRFLDMGHLRALLDLLIAEQATDREQLQNWSEYSCQLRDHELRAFGTHLPPLDKAGSSTTDVAETKLEYLEKIQARLKAELEPISLTKLVPDVEVTASLNEMIYNSIATDALVVHINISRDGLLILCISSNGIENICFDEITDIEVEKHIFRCLKLFRDGENGKMPDLSSCQEALINISNIVIEPISQYLRTRDHIMFVPSRSLNKFPFSALTLDGQPLFLTKDVSMCPSIAALGRLVKRQRDIEGSVGVVYNDAKGPRPLPLSAAASVLIARAFDTVPRPTTVASHKDFSSLYEQSSIMFIATHGTQHKQSAWQSTLALNPPFRVLDLSRMRSSAALVIFEACVSGLGEETVGDDMLGFSHIVLSSGASAFLGALWTPEKNKAEEAIKSVSIVRCWRTAQLQLYEANASRAISTFQEMADQCQEAEKAQKQPDGTKRPALVSRSQSKRFQNALRSMVETIETEGVDYKHPFYWAPYVLVGNGGLLV